MRVVRLRRCVRAGVLIGTLAAGFTWAQSSGGGDTKPGTGGGGNTGGTPTAPARPLTSVGGGGPSTLENKKPGELLYISGRVMMEDGTEPGEFVTLDLICRGQSRPYGVTNVKGEFNLNLARPDAFALSDAGVRMTTRPSGDNAGGFDQVGMTDLVGCDLRAHMPGFLSQAIALGDRRSADTPEVGVLVLHPLGSISGYTISMNSATAPSEAKRALQRGVDAAKKNDWDEAERQLRRAIDVYPKYAEAWEALGRLHEVQHDLNTAKSDYSESAKLDPKYVVPHLRLMVLAGAEQDWTAVAAHSGAVIERDPFSYPIAYYLKAVACLNLDRNADAEDAARRGLRIDVQAQMPRLNQILGSLLMDRGAYAEAIQYLKAYLALRPKADDAEQMQRMIVDSEQQIARKTTGAATDTPR